MVLFSFVASRLWCATRRSPLDIDDTRCALPILAMIVARSIQNPKSDVE
jgi:hypothetical protein